MYEELKSSLEEAIEFHKGNRKLRTRRVVVPDPPPSVAPGDVVKLRRSLAVSQRVFSEILNVSVKTVQAWEAGRRRPAQSALRLLEIIKEHPEYLHEKSA